LWKKRVACEGCYFSPTLSTSVFPALSLYAGFFPIAFLFLLLVSTVIACPRKTAKQNLFFSLIQNIQNIDLQKLSSFVQIITGMSD